MYHSIYYIKLDQLFQKMNIPKFGYQDTCVLLQQFSVAKIPIKHCSLYNKTFLSLLTSYYFFSMSYRAVIGRMWQIRGVVSLRS